MPRATDELLGVKTLLLRGTNWIGDVVMSLPAVQAVRKSLPGARIAVLAKPWVADLYRMTPGIDEVMLYRSPGIHDGINGKMRLIGDLKAGCFDAALLFQNAIEAAILTALARIPLRAGYSTDGRGLLLTHPVRKREGVELLHQSRYYLEMVRALGFTAAPGDVLIQPDEGAMERAGRILAEAGVGEDEDLVGMAPGAAYGPAKMWFADRFAALADRYVEGRAARVLLFGSGADAAHTAAVAGHARHEPVDLAGRTSLAEAAALIRQCRLFLSNDSGLMHLAGGLGVPLIAVFGSTNPRTTSPLGAQSHVLYRQVACSPCLKKTCPGDFSCMDAISVDDVWNMSQNLTARQGEGRDR